ncbi:arf-GAP domain and FG repeat-containing protein 1 isoform X2 [Bacillus rossius redtenbacheri]|uniref:arf-GAP domain and FG repeat-containing protein 1 isoform X2 n=1 Tax=Bacillus rossius redtenbacheri TaxID=93214 RepID=UPI002FDD3EE4
MASARKKQDEKHLKILRELVSLPSNKECFDCHQRGPTYVNMTIGSFVCTSCSGMLRGLTPPHRVKSISMATFSPEEIELIRARGNEYCRRTWLGLYDANTSDTKDEQQVKAFMVAKYEKKRYYLEPAAASEGPAGFSPPPAQSRSRTSTPTPAAAAAFPEVRPLAHLLGQGVRPLAFAAQAPSDPANMFTPDKSPSEFTADFGRPDPFTPSPQLTSGSSEASFADFDNNPVFSQASMPTAAALASMSPFASPARRAASTAGVAGGTQPPGRPTAEDRYAALKDLDCQMKSQQSEAQLNDWSVAATTSGNVWTNNSNSTQAGFADSSVANPFTGSHALRRRPAIRRKRGARATHEAWWLEPAAPPGSRNPWAPAVPTSHAPDAFGANPFRATRRTDAPFGGPADGFQAWGAAGLNGVPNGQVSNGVAPAAYHPSLAAGVFPTSQSMTFPAKPWQAHPSGNPFALGASPAPAVRSSNPFL